jgi:hypothetical protein
MRHDRLVVLHDDDRLAGVDRQVEQAEQLLDVGEPVEMACAAGCVPSRR